MGPNAQQKRDLLTKLLQQKLAAKAARQPADPIAAYPNDAIAVIGLAGRYPDAPDLATFWQNLLAGRDCIGEIPASRWSWQDYQQGHQGNSARLQGGFIADVDQFDAEFFGISPREAASMDPQERLFLQTAWHTLEDAGYTPTTVAAGTGNVGVFVGAMNANYSMLGAARWQQTQQTEQNFMCNPMFWSLANRVSYTLNFNGPSMAVDTACSSSLTAIHLACESIRRQECDVALAGGVNLILHPAQLEVLAKKGMLSPTGRCHSFGQGADGFVDGEGVGAVLLKPLAQALRDGDHIYGIVRGHSLNAGGKTSGYTVPSPQAQANLISRVLQQSQTDPSQISYVEAHGTGTALGDPIEVRGLVKAFALPTADERAAPQAYCALGSVKSNIGHLEAAAGISGVTKVLLQMRHQTLVPTLHSAQPSEWLDLTGSPFYLPQQATPWLPGQNKLAAISGFGAGGANAHLLLQSVELPRRTGPAPECCLILLSAASAAQLLELAAALQACLLPQQQHTALSLVDIAHTLWEGRQAYPVRLAVITSDVLGLQAALTQYLRGDTAGSFWLTGTVEASQQPTAQSELLAQSGALSPWTVDVLQRFAKAWVVGAVQQPTGIYQAWQPRRVSLPGYPFLRERHWLPTLPAGSSLSASAANTSTAHTSAPSSAPSVPTALAMDDETTLASQLLTPSWQVVPAATTLLTDATNADSAPRGQVLLFATDPQPSAALAAQFPRLSIVTLGSGFQQIDPDHYQISQQEPADIALLLAQILAHGPLQAVIYQWQGETVAANTKRHGAESLYAGVQPLFSLVQQLLRVAPTCRLLVWSQDQGRQTALAALALSGLIKSIRAEHPDVAITQVIFTEEMALASQTAALAVELAQPLPGAAVVKYQQQQRWLEQLVQVEPVQAMGSSFHAGGVYLITGGMGGLGQIFARHIAALGGVKLVLTGRSALAEPQQAVLQQLKTPVGVAQPNEVVYYRCDVANAEDVALLFEKIKLRFTRLTGIIHSAGVVRDGLLARKSWADFYQVANSKLKGIVYLDQASAAMALDFFVAFSSVSAVLGNQGQTDYAFGNAYLDAFCRWRQLQVQQGLRQGRSVSMNWPIWQQGGMHIAPAVLAGLKQSIGMVPLSTELGLQLFEQMMASDMAQLMPLYGVKTRLDRLVQQRNGVVTVEPATVAPSTTASVAMPAPVADRPPVFASSESQQLSVWLEQQLRQLISQAIQLPAPRIDAQKAFADLGFDSVVLREFASQAQAVLAIEFSPTLLFAHNTLAKLQQYLLAEYQAPLMARAGLGNTATASSIDMPVAASAGGRSEPALLGSQPMSQPAISLPPTQHKPEPVAIIGMDGMFPGAADLAEFWSNLQQGVDPIREIPASRFAWQQHYGSSLGQAKASTTNSKWGGFMPDIEHFDHQFFELSADEALYMDPQQRLFLQTVWKTIESAGYSAAALKSQAIGVFVGVEFSDYKDYLAQHAPRYNAEMVIGNALNMIPNRVSYYFDFTGPSEAVDTACSSSLVALHRAVRSIQSGESSMAIAGGVSVILSPQTMIGTSQLNIYSKDGRCKTFDQDANGYVKGEGVAAVLLKPLSAALRDGDQILAVVKGAAVNHGGRSHSITAPNPAAQARLLVQAYREAGLSAQRVSYLELHGTATNLGDPVEIEGIKAAFSQLASAEQLLLSALPACGIGSVKSNIGHLEPAAGIAGLCKVVLAMQAGQLPGNLHFNQLNPLIRLEQTPFYIVKSTQPWQRQTDAQGHTLPLVAGVSSFGFGGSNAHVVLEEWLAAPTLPDTAAPMLLLLSAKTEAQLTQKAVDLLAFLATEAGRRLSCRDLVYTLQVGRQPMTERLALTVQSMADLQQQLQDYLAGKLDDSGCRGSCTPDRLRMDDLLDANLQQYILTHGQCWQLAKWWLLGVNFEWSLWYQQQPARRVALPTYPFAKTRCWLDAIPVIQTPSVEHGTAPSRGLVATSHLVTSNAATSTAATLTMPFSPPTVSDDVAAAIRQQVAQLAGVAVSGLTAQTHLAADLGIDSIKMMSLINELISARPEAELAYFNQLGMNQIIGQSHTLGSLIEVFQQASRQTASTQTPAPMSAALEERGGEQVTDTIADAIEDLSNAQIDPQQAVPLLDAQQLFLPAYFLTDSSSLCSAVTLEGPLDLKLANQVWQQLIERHPVLQLQFCWPSKTAATFADVTAHFVQNWQPPQMQLIDLSSVSDQDAALQQAFDQQLNRHWDMQQWPLHAFTLYQLAAEKHLLLWSNEHIISDGLSNQQALREFLQLYQAALSGQTLPLPACHLPTHYRALVEQMNQRAAALPATVSASTGSYLFNPAKRKRDRKKATFVCREQLLDAQLTEQLIALTGRSGFSMNTLLVTTFAQVIASLAPNAAQLLLQVPTSGRNSPDLALQHTLGCFALNLSVQIDTAQLKNLPQVLQQVQHRIDTAVLDGEDVWQGRELGLLLRQLPLNGQNRLPEHAAQMMLAAVKSNLYCPYTGHTGIASQYGPLAVTSYRAGTTNSPGSIDLLQEIFAGQLHLFLNYDQSFFPAKLMTQLLQRYVAALQALVVDARLQPAPLLAAVQEPEVDAALIRAVLVQANQVLPQSLQDADMDKDLVAELGFDSIDKIRLVTQLYQQQPALDRAALMKCRSLAQMAQAIAQCQSPFAVANSASCELNSVVAVNTVAATAVAASEAAIPAAATDVTATVVTATPIERIVLQARLTPEAIAVTHTSGRQLTYRELDQQSNQIARVLVARGVGRHDFVGVLSNRGPQMLVAILAVLKAGAAYVPVDPSYPLDRIRYILRHSAVTVLLTDPALTDIVELLCPASEAEQPALPALQSLLLLDDASVKQRQPLERIQPALTVLNPAQWRQHSTAALTLTIDPNDNMVVLFTSGSTGQPKGVVLNHAGYQNRLNWHQQLFQLQPGERVAQKTSCCFDVSLWELFWPLMFGGVVCAVDKDTVANPWAFAEWLEAAQINIAHFVPSMFGAFISNIDTKQHQFKALRWLAFSGEALATHTVQQWIDAYQLRVGLCNLYGPTEASIDVTYHVIQQRPADAEPIPIGQAIDQVSCVVLDEKATPVPAGTMGELYLGGVQLAKGYLHEPELTAKAFIPNPFAWIDSATLYKTGDLVTQNPDGSLNYHGRSDSQVKIRGFRVELGEIENIVSSHPEVQEAAVLLVKQQEADKLILWYAGAELSDQVLKAFIAKRCPDYMVPHFVYRSAQALPKNSNGKLDRQALLRSLATHAEAAAAESAVVDRVVGNAVANGVVNVVGNVVVNVVGTDTAVEVLPVGPAQQWIFSYFNEPYQWFGCSQQHYLPPLDLARFATAVNLLICQFAELRTTFAKQPQGWTQQIAASCPPLPLIQHNTALTGEALTRYIDALAHQLAADLRYDQWPLCRFAVIELADGSCRILWVSHHLIADLVAGQVLATALWNLYQALPAGATAVPAELLTTLPAPEPSRSYPAFVRWLQQQAAPGSPTYQQWLSFWQQQTALQRQCCLVPVDFDHGANVESSEAKQCFVLEKSQIDLIQRQAFACFDSHFYPVLCAPVYQLMAALTQAAVVTVSHKLNGRNIGAANQHYFGCGGNFAINAPLTVAMKKQGDFSALIQAIRDGLAAMPCGGASYDWVSAGLAATQYPDQQLTGVRVNYLGDISAGRQADFANQPAEQNQRLSFPAQQRTCLIEFFIYHQDKNTYLDISYSNHLYSAQTIQALGRNYVKILGDIVKNIRTLSGSLVD